MPDVTPLSASDAGAPPAMDLTQIIDNGTPPDMILAPNASADKSPSIRNIIQSHTERTIIKQSPDLIVYINGLPYVINNWGPSGPAIVNFNDYVVAGSGASDVNTFIPGATINLSVPNHQKALFMAPGGNCPFYTMAEIKVFTRGYYLTKDGDTVYHRVFWGLIDNVTQVESETSLEITLACKGIMHLFDLMQYNTNPAVMTADQAGTSVTPYQSTMAYYTPLQSIVNMFVAPLGDQFSGIDTVDLDTLAPTQASGIGGSDANAARVLNDVYVSKWLQHLKNLQLGVRVFGLNQDIRDCTYDGVKSDANKTASMAGRIENGAVHNTKSEVAASTIYNFDLIQQFLPAFRIGEIQLLASSIVPRLQIVMEMVDRMGWEGYQDVDGSIVIKPPLYNLNPLNTTAPADRNPFIINLDEKLGSDQLMEDESQIHLTRVAVQGTLNASNDIAIDIGGVNFLPVGVYADPILVRQFGMRHEGVKQISWIGTRSDTLYAYAVSELTKTNKRWKSYTVTIPMRPELRLGFPIHIAWRDIMGYLENVSWNYTRGSAATMTLLCAMVRNRELFGAMNGGSMTYVPVRNAILRWTTEPPAPTGVGVVNTDATVTNPPELLLNTLQKNFLLKTDSLAGVVGNPPELPGCAWRVTDDTGTSKDKKLGIPDSAYRRVGAGYTEAMFKKRFSTSFFAVPRGASSDTIKKRVAVDNAYCLAIQTCAMPYTDDEGYILARPFPWGRYTTLEAALDMFTRSRDHQTGTVLPFEAAPDQTFVNEHASDPFLTSKTDAFILTGLGTPSVGNGVTGAEGNSVLKKIADLMAFIEDDTTNFVVTYPDTDDPSASGLSPNPYNGTRDALLQASLSQPAADAPNPGMSLPGVDPAKLAAFSRDMITPSGTSIDATSPLVKN